MASSPELAMKRLRELLPENGKDIPDEFILEILRSCDFDLTRAFEDLQERLSRASWTSVEKAKKKKAESIQNSSQNGTRRRGTAPSGRYESQRIKDPWEAKDMTNRPKNSAQFRGQQATKNTPKICDTATGTRNNTSTDTARNVAAPVTQERKPAENSVAVTPITPGPVCNQWAKGRPKIDPPKEKENVVPQPQISEAEISISKPAEIPAAIEAQSSSPTNHGTSDSASIHSTESGENHAADSADTKEEIALAAEPAPEQHLENETFTDESNSQPSKQHDDEEVVREELERLAVNSAAVRPPEDAPTEKVPANTMFGVDGIMPGYASEGSQAVYATQQPAYHQNFQASQLPQAPQQQQHYSAPFDEPANNGKRFYMNGSDSGYAMQNAPGNASTRVPQMQYGGKPFASKPQQAALQQQSLGWQPQYGMMGTSMYPMSPQQLQMMYMQSFGMGMPYPAGSMNGQMMNGNNAYGPMNGSNSFGQNAFSAPAPAAKTPFQHNKKNQHYAGNFNSMQYDASLQYGQMGNASEEYFKGAGESTFGYGYGNGMNFDGNGSSYQPAQQGYGNARCAPNNTNIGGPMNPQDMAPGAGPWIGGN